MTRILGVVLALLALFTLRSAVFVVHEAEQAIITQLGKPIGEPITSPGLHVKLPFIQKVLRFDKRFLEWEGKRDEMTTEDKVFIQLETYGRWRITDPLVYLQRLQNEARAQTRLDAILDRATKDTIAQHRLLEVIRSSNREAVRTEADDDIEAGLEPIKLGRARIIQEILEAAQPATDELGIEILDVQLKRVNYGEQVLNDVYNRMISERVRISDRFRSEGQGQRAEILGNMERELQRIRSEAYRKTQEIRGRADAEATDIYARAYNQTADSRRFYEFQKSMETLEQTVDDETWLLLSTDGDFYRFLEGSDQ